VPASKRTASRDSPLRGFPGRRARTRSPSPPKTPSGGPTRRGPGVRYARK
jgi:hypothetical protein